MPIKIHPLFWVLAIIAIFTGFGLVLIFGIVAVLLHEMCHYAVARHYGFSAKKVSLMPYGAMLTIDEGFNKKEGIAIALAGPLGSLLVSLIVLGSWWIFPQSYSVTEDFFIVNLMLFAFNLLPVFPLDGSRIVMSFNNTNKAQKIMRWFGICVAITFLVAFFVSAFFVINYSLAIMGIFLLFGAMFEPKEHILKRLTDKMHHIKKYITGVEIVTFQLSYKSILLRVVRLLSSSRQLRLIVVDDLGQTLAILEESDIEELFNKYSLKDTLEKILISEKILNKI